MPLVSDNEHLQVAFADELFPVRTLTEFGFQLVGDLTNRSYESPQLAELVFGDRKIEVHFRVRQQTSEFAKCTLSGTTLAQRSEIKSLIETLRLQGDGDALSSLSYDELASGETESKGEKTTAASSASSKTTASRGVKSVVAMMLGLGMLAVVVLGIGLLLTRCSVDVSNAALVGNYLPVHAKADGEVIEVCFNESTAVKKGDVLIRLRNSQFEALKAQAEAQLRTATETVGILEQRVSDYRAMIVMMSEKLSIDSKAAKESLRLASENLRLADAQVKQFEPFVRSGAVTQIEFDQARFARAAREAERDVMATTLDSLALSRKALSKNALLFGDKIDDALSGLTAELEIARSEKQQAKVLLKIAVEQIEQLNIVAPNDGRVFACYRQPGEYLRMADEAVALTLPGDSWAAGQVSANDAVRIRPGHVVRVSIPAFDLKTEGTVSAVGHRAVYAKGGYNGDFRGTLATDVPIKISLSDLPEEIPSGVRLDMVVSLGFGIAWLDEMMGTTLRLEESEPVLAADARNTESRLVNVIPVTE